MTKSWLLAPIPKWVIINNEGTVAGGAKMYTYRSLNKVEKKSVYQDPGGKVPYTNPVIFGLNGTQGPFYWEVNSAFLTDTYWLEVYDADDNLLWTLDHYFPPGEGGGGDVTTNVSTLNYITNNQFIDHISDTASPVPSTNLLIAPSNHKGFTPAYVGPLVGTYGVLGPDIRFVKSSLVNTDQITFPEFPLASAPLIGDVTPVNFVRYQCTTSNPGEDYKAFQFPITQKVKNLANKTMTFNVWARVAASPASIEVYVRQFFGSSPGATADRRTKVADFALDTTWTLHTAAFTIPTVEADSIGAPGTQTDDDALYIQLEMPRDVACDIYFIKPALYLGNLTTLAEFQSYDQINAVNSTARTGDVKPSLSPSFPLGWLPMDDGTIGNVGSGASTRANKDTFQLFTTVYTGVADTWAPVSGGRTAPGDTVAAAITDFLAGKTITLPRNLGRVIGGAGGGLGLTFRDLGQYLGAEAISLDAMPEHTHPPLSPATNFVGLVGASVEGTQSPRTGNPLVTSLATTGPRGGSAADGNMPPSSYMNMFIKL